MKIFSKLNKCNFEDFKNFCKEEIKSNKENCGMGLIEFIFYCNLITNLW